MNKTSPTKRETKPMRHATWWKNPTIKEKAMAYDLITIGGFVDERKAIKALRIAHQILKTNQP